MYIMQHHQARVLYSMLREASTENIQYLKDATIFHCMHYCAQAVDPDLSGPMVHHHVIRDIENYSWSVQSETDPLIVIDMIRHIANDCYMGANRDPRYHRDWGERKQILLKTTKMIYSIFCLGFADICCTMKGGLSIIDPNASALAQILNINWSRTSNPRIQVEKYPRLLNWVDQTCDNWEEGLESICDVYRRAAYSRVVYNEIPGWEYYKQTYPVMCMTQPGWEEDVDSFM